MADLEMKSHFLGWQCRIRQIAMRDYGGQPLEAMRPRVSDRSGETLLAAMTVLLIPLAPEESTAFFRFQVLKTHETSRQREAAVAYLASGFYQEPDLFGDEMTAIFDAESAIAGQIVGLRTVVLDFAQFGQAFRMFCKVRRLDQTNEMREASLWQARLFNPNLPADAAVLGFRPEWNSAEAVPWVGS